MQKQLSKILIYSSQQRVYIGLTWEWHWELDLYTEMYVTTKVKKWMEEFCKLSSFALTQCICSHCSWPIWKMDLSSLDSSLYQQSLSSFGTCHSTSFLACFDRKTKHRWSRELLFLLASLEGISIINPFKWLIMNLTCQHKLPIH